MEETVDKNYLKGFNEGYIITEHLPALSDDLAKIQSLAVRLEGFRDGRKQFTLEQVRDHRPSWLQSNSPATDKFQARDKNIDPDLDHS